MFRKIKLKFVINFLQHEMSTLDNYWCDVEKNGLLDSYNRVLIDLHNKEILNI